MPSPYRDKEATPSVSEGVGSLWDRPFFGAPFLCSKRAKERRILAPDFEEMQQFSRLETGPMWVTQEGVEAKVFAGDLRVLRIASRVSKTSRPEFNSTPRRRLASAERLPLTSKDGCEAAVT